MAHSHPATVAAVRHKWVAAVAAVAAVGTAAVVAAAVAAAVSGREQAVSAFVN